MRLASRAAVAFAFAAAAALAAAQARRAPGAGAAEPPKCLLCHAGIEEMHPKPPVGCVECHGGDARAEKKEEAHVPARFPPPGDERVLPPGFDPAVARFRNPMDLRIVKDTCGVCHPDEVDRVALSLHASTAGHLGDGLYENGVLREKHPRVAVFAVTDPRFEERSAPQGAVRSLQRIGAFKGGSDPRSVATHFSDVPRKSCMQCHLWSRGRAVRGRLGMDGDYRGEGCAACHVRYEDDGISRTADRSIAPGEAGHPARHSLQRAPDTATCAHCHNGDASIGLSFRGLAQPVPGMPQSPDAAGLAPRRLNGVFYMKDPSVDPADVHHLAGMQCADCHTGQDLMGDGHLYARMEDAVEIECSTCHGTWDHRATGLTERGRPFSGLEIRADGVWLRSRSDGKSRRVKQARDVVDPRSQDFNDRAAMAMTTDHERLECYACHAGWTPNFFGFHFDRNEGFTQLDLLDGARTPGRVSTQEKVFATFKQLYLGWGSEGAVAPYMVGFSTMATVHAADGTLLLDQEMPVTQAGLSGMTMVHHQPHSTTPRARTCVECHRAPAALGFGSVNFRLGRELLFDAGDRGLQVLGFDRKAAANTRVLGQVALPPVRAFQVRSDDLQGRAAWAFAATADGDLWALDVRSPLFPKVVGKLEGAVEDPRQLLVADDTLYVADAKRGLVVVDASSPSRMKVLGTTAPVAPAEIRGLFLDGFWLYAAAGPAGLLVYDVGDPAAPVLLSRVRLGDPEVPDDARAVSVLFQFSRPNEADPLRPRRPARGLAAVANGHRGLSLVDVTRPETPRLIGPVPAGNVLDVALGTFYDLGSEGGGIASKERDLAVLVTPEALGLLDVSDTVGPPVLVAARQVPGGGARSLRIHRTYNPPFLQAFAVVGAANAVHLFELTRPSEPALRATVPALGGGLVSAEEFPLDRMIDSRARPLKDVSHEGARYLDAEEARRVLTAPVR